MIRKASLMGLIIGAAGIAGAIELGKGWILSILIVVLSLTGLYMEVSHVEKKHDRDNCANYPCFLKK